MKVNTEYVECEWCGASTLKEEWSVTQFCGTCQMKCRKFWNEFHKRTFDNLHDYSTVQLVDRHRNVLGLKYEPYQIANLLIGKHYGADVWSSRSLSGTIAGLFDCDYLLCYCASSRYIGMMLKPRGDDAEAIAEFDKADALDECWRQKNEKTISKSKPITSVVSGGDTSG